MDGYFACSNQTLFYCFCGTKNNSVYHVFVSPHKDLHISLFNNRIYLSTLCVSLLSRCCFVQEIIAIAKIDYI